MVVPAGKPPLHCSAGVAPRACRRWSRPRTPGCRSGPRGPRPCRRQRAVGNSGPGFDAHACDAGLELHGGRVGRPLGRELARLGRPRHGQRAYGLARAAGIVEPAGERVAGLRGGGHRSGRQRLANLMRHVVNSSAAVRVELERHGVGGPGGPELGGALREGRVKLGHGTVGQSSVAEPAGERVSAARVRLRNGAVGLRHRPAGPACDGLDRSHVAGVHVQDDLCVVGLPLRVVRHIGRRDLRQAETQPSCPNRRSPCS